MASLVSMFSKVKPAAQRWMQPEALVCFCKATPGSGFASAKGCFLHSVFEKESLFLNVNHPFRRKSKAKLLLDRCISDFT